jgi:hypothetical protein
MSRLKADSKNMFFFLISESPGNVGSIGNIGFKPYAYVVLSKLV